MFFIGLILQKFAASVEYRFFFIPIQNYAYLSGKQQLSAPIYKSSYGFSKL